jgi:hypothetical protein
MGCGWRRRGGYRKDEGADRLTYPGIPQMNPGRVLEYRKMPGHGEIYGRPWAQPGMGAP